MKSKQIILILLIIIILLKEYSEVAFIWTHSYTFLLLELVTFKMFRFLSDALMQQVRITPSLMGILLIVGTKDLNDKLGCVFVEREQTVRKTHHQVS